MVTELDSRVAAARYASEGEQILTGRTINCNLFDVCESFFFGYLCRRLVLRFDVDSALWSSVSKMADPGQEQLVVFVWV